MRSSDMSASNAWAEQNKDVITFCVAVKEDQENGMQIAVYEREEGFLILGARGNPEQEKFMDQVLGYLSPFGITDESQTQSVEFFAGQQGSTIYRAEVANVPSDMEAPQNYKFVPLENNIAGSMATVDARTAIYGLVRHYNSPRINRDKNLG